MSVAAAVAVAEENKRTILRVLTAYNERNLEVFYGGFDPQCSFPSLTEFGLPPTLESFKVIIEAMLMAFPKMKNSVKEIFANGDKVVAWVTETGIHEGTYLNIPATNRLVTYSEFVIYRLANGRIVEWTFNFDVFSIYQQIGVLTK